MESGLSRLAETLAETLDVLSGARCGPVHMLWEPSGIIGLNRDALR
jgi:hypothetical protein